MPHRKSAPKEGFFAQVTVPVLLLLKKCSLVFLIAAVVGIILLSTVDNKATFAVRAAIMDVATPVLAVFSRPFQQMVHVQEWFHNILHLKEENERLRQENIKLLQHYEHSKYVETENASLRQLLHVVNEARISFITARVVSSTSGPYIRSALINAGSKHQVKKGQAIVNIQGVVGRIIEVSNHSARILLVTDINSKIPVMTAESRERGIVAGDNSDKLYLRYLPEDTKVKVGEMIVTSGDGEFFPPGLLIGTVQSVGSQIVVKPAVEWGKLEFVSVVNY